MQQKIVHIFVASPKPTSIDLAVYNAKGELIKKLYAGQQTAGKHVAAFDATGFNSGVYYIRLKFGSNAKTRKVLMVK